MVYSKNSNTNLVTLALFFAATVLLICSWPLIISLRKSYDHNTTNIPLLQKDELEIALERASMANKTVVIAVINRAYVETRRNDFPAMFDLFLEGFWAGEGTRPLLEHLLVVAMDETAHERCVFRRLNCYSLAAEGGGDRFAGEKIYMSKEFIEMMWRRTLFLLDVIKRGYSFIFTDTDIIWLRNPFPLLITNETLDLQLSTDNLDGDTPSSSVLINTGFYFVRSNTRTVSLFQTWYDMRENSTGMKEQDVLAKLIRGGILRRLNVSSRYLDTLYFSGFCKDSKDVRKVVTVHANCCRSIGAKVADLKVVLKDWGRRNAAAGEFRWSLRTGCAEAWRKDPSLE